MESDKKAVRILYYWCYTRTTGEQFRRRDLLESLEIVEREASALQSAGRQGMIIRTFDPLYDEETGSFRNNEILNRF